MESTIDELDELLSSETPELNDPAFPAYDGPERRADVRHPFLAEVVAVLLKSANDAAEVAESTPDTLEQQFNLVRGQTLNLSPGGVCFLLPEKLDDDELLLLIRHPDFDYPKCCFHARVFRIEQDQDGFWEYGALLRPLTGPDISIDVAGF